MPRSDMFSMDKYAEGFVEACAQAGVDPAALVKLAQMTNLLGNTSLPGGAPPNRPANWRQQQAPEGGWSYAGHLGQAYRQGAVSPSAYSGALAQPGRLAGKGKATGSAILNTALGAGSGGPVGAWLGNRAIDAGEFIGGMLSGNQSGPTQLDKEKQLAAAEAQKQVEAGKTRVEGGGPTLFFERTPESTQRSLAAIAPKQ